MILFLTITNLLLLAIIGIILVYMKFERTYHNVWVEARVSQTTSLMAELQGRDEIIENYEQDFLSKDEKIEELTKQCVEHEEEIGQLNDTARVQQNVNIMLWAEMSYLRDRNNELFEVLKTKEEIVQFHANNCMPHLSEIRKLNVVKSE